MRSLMKRSAVVVATAIAAACVAQPAPVTVYDTELAGPSLTPPVVTKLGDLTLTEVGVVVKEGAAFAQLKLDGTPWPEGGVLEIESLYDGDVQVLDEASAEAWGFRSAWLNGGAFVVRWLASADAALPMPASAQYGMPLPGDDGDFAKSICGTDNRVRSSRGASARIFPVGCTAWMTLSGAMATAGHCVGSASSFETGQAIQYNVPSSLTNGTTQNPPARDQYPVVRGSTRFTNGGTGVDWGAFRVSSNGSGITAQSRGFLQVARTSVAASNAANIMILGYGVDSTPAGSSGGRNADNQTLQEHASFWRGTGSNNTRAFYKTDTTGGNSGSPVIEMVSGSLMSIGIHTHGGCSSETGSDTNSGTLFLGQTTARNDLDAVTGAAIVYVNSAFVQLPDSPASDGDLFTPFTSLDAGVNGTPLAGTLAVAPGTYGTGTLGGVISRPMTITAPVGPVVLTR